jgi:hypothetical protein
MTPPLSFSQVTDLKKIAKKSNLQAKGDAIGMAIQVAGTIGSAIIGTVYAVRQEKQRQQMIESLDALNEQQITELGESLQRINDVNDRIEKFTSFVSLTLANKSSSDINKQIENKNLGKVNSDKKLIYMFVGISVALLIGIIVIKKINK